MSSAVLDLDLLWQERTQLCRTRLGFAQPDLTGFDLAGLGCARLGSAGRELFHSFFYVPSINNYGLGWAGLGLAGLVLAALGYGCLGLVFFGLS